MASAVPSEVYEFGDFSPAHRYRHGMPAYTFPVPGKLNSDLPQEPSCCWCAQFRPCTARGGAACPPGWREPSLAGLTLFIHAYPALIARTAKPPERSGYRAIFRRAFAALNPSLCFDKLAAL